MTSGAKAVKQVLVIRKDLKMRRGKECAQANHASVMCLLKGAQEADGELRVTLTPAVESWLLSGQPKITLQVSSEEELLDVYHQACERNLRCALVQDHFKQTSIGCTRT